jgi:hypothetical protein
MSVTFLIPVRHQDGVADYPRLWNLLKDTLASVAAQVNLDWHAIVVANKMLPVPNTLPLDKITFISLERQYKGWSPLKFETKDFKKHLIDKAMRRRCGVIHARNAIKPDWFFMVDADDYVSRDLVATIKYMTEPQHKMVVVETGLMVSAARQVYTVTDDFNIVCGTSLGIRADYLYQQMEVNEQRFHTLLSQHHAQYFPMAQREMLRLRGTPYAAYLLHDQNHGVHLWKYDEQMRKPFYITPGIRERFTIPEPEEG